MDTEAEFIQLVQSALRWQKIRIIFNGDDLQVWHTLKVCHTFFVRLISF